MRGRSQGRARKKFFFEKKNQKTFALIANALERRDKTLISSMVEQFINVAGMRVA
jgi:hypothetical protein